MASVPLPYLQRVRDILKCEGSDLGSLFFLFSFYKKINRQSGFRLLPPLTFLFLRSLTTTETSQVLEANTRAPQPLR